MNTMIKRLMLEESTTGLSGSSFNGGTGITVDMPDFNFGGGGTSGAGSSASNTGSGSTSGGGFFDGFNLNGLLNTLLKGGMTWAQIEAAKKGKDVYIQGQGGQKENITPILVSKLKEQAETQQKTTTEILKMMQAQMQQQQNPPAKKDNTLMYVGIGVGVLVLLGGGIYMINSSKSKNN
ncbi:hypothetical protein [Tenacibaculum litopenaei]|uniref:hypothetical protein n=1 Tax=Tenacibaculum litopenaei TaxID=396016 RepID=UPI0038B5265E